MKIIISHPTGNANVRAVSTALARTQLLHRFFTCVALFEKSLFYKICKIQPFKEFQRRSFDDVIRPYTQTRPLKELGRLASQKLGWKLGVRHEKGFFCIDQVYKDLDKHVSRQIKDSKAVYAYEDGAFETFRKAKLKGVTCLYDLPTGYWRAHRELLSKEINLRPDWAMTFRCFQDSELKLARKDSELEYADAVFVASSFTRRTLELYPGVLPPVHLIPYGFPDINRQRTYIPLKGRKLKMLFVGGLSQMKGLANLFEAVEYFKDQVELTIVGRKKIDGCIPLEEGLKKHKWIPSLPHKEVLELMSKQDLFVFPSLFEGYGLVVAESMSQGTPVITTRRTCGADFITDNENGWLVEAGKTAELVEKIQNILAEPECLCRVGKAALETAASSPIREYGIKMAEAIKEEVA